MRPKLRKDMTRGEFEKLANRRPNLDGDWLYRYVGYTIDASDALSDDTLYPKFDLFEEDKRIFRTFEDAERHLMQIKPTDPDDRFYCHYIRQIPVGEYEGDEGACWLYDADKNLIDYSITQWTAKNPEDYHFFGKPQEMIRFAPGEIVEVRTGSEVRLAMLVHPSIDVEWCWQYLQRCRACEDGETMGYALDGSDDACYIIDGPDTRYHDHVSPLRIMKPHFPIPEDIRKTMEGWLESFKQSLEKNREL